MHHLLRCQLLSQDVCRHFLTSSAESFTCTRSAKSRCPRTAFVFSLICTNWAGHLRNHQVGASPLWLGSDRGCWASFQPAAETPTAAACWLHCRGTTRCSEAASTLKAALPEAGGPAGAPPPTLLPASSAAAQQTLDGAPGSECGHRQGRRSIPSCMPYSGIANVPGNTCDRVHCVDRNEACKEQRFKLEDEPGSFHSSLHPAIV